MQQLKYVQYAGQKEIHASSGDIFNLVNCQDCKIETNLALPVNRYDFVFLINIFLNDNCVCLLS